MSKSKSSVSRSRKKFEQRVKNDFDSFMEDISEDDLLNDFLGSSLIAEPAIMTLPTSLQDHSTESSQSVGSSVLSDGSMTGNGNDTRSVSEKNKSLTSDQKSRFSISRDYDSFFLEELNLLNTTQQQGQSSPSSAIAVSNADREYFHSHSHSGNESSHGLSSTTMGVRPIRSQSDSFPPMYGHLTTNPTTNVHFNINKPQLPSIPSNGTTDDIAISNHHVAGEHSTRKDRVMSLDLATNPFPLNSTNPNHLPLSFAQHDARKGSQLPIRSHSSTSTPISRTYRATPSELQLQRQILGKDSFGSNDSIDSNFQGNATDTTDHGHDD